MAAITVIVPVYQAEKYLRKCIDSILSQSFSDFDLILVDDGSVDASGLICDEYASSDARVKVIHKENGGVSSARNAALDKIESRYVTFCDSDDYWAEDWLENLYRAGAASDADVVSAGILSVTEEGTVLRHSNYESGSFLIHNESERTDFLVHLMLRLGWAVYTRLFKTDIIQRNRIRFCESCENYAEDLCFVLEYSLYCKRIEACGFQGYYYVQHHFQSGVQENLPERRKNPSCGYPRDSGLQVVQIMEPEGVHFTRYLLPNCRKTGDKRCRLEGITLSLQSVGAL